MSQLLLSFRFHIPHYEEDTALFIDQKCKTQRAKGFMDPRELA